MGLKTWKAAPDGKILKSDVVVAKNYLNHQHVSELNRIVSAYLDLAENNAQRGLAFSMQQWASFLEKFLELSNYPVLKDKGKVSMLEAKLKAETEFEKFRINQDQNYESDFDREIKKLKVKIVNRWLVKFGPLRCCSQEIQEYSYTINNKEEQKRTKNQNLTSIPRVTVRIKTHIF